MRIFGYLDYKAYLAAVFPTDGQNRGGRAKLARTLKCQPAFVSQVLHGLSHLSQDHAFAISQHLGLDHQETEYLMLLVQYERAGTPELKHHLRSKMEDIRRSSELIKNQVTASGDVSRDDREIYYSSWHYAAIHVMTSVPQLQTLAAIAKHLGLPLPATKEYLSFLVRAGLVHFDGETYQITARRIHLGQEAAQIVRSQTSWRLRAIHDLENRVEESLHFSSILSVSVKDAKLIKEILLQAITQQEKIMIPSKEEAVFCLCMDFFRL